MDLARRPAAFTAVLLTAGALGAGVALAASDSDPDPSFNDGAPLAIDFPSDAHDYVGDLATGADGSLAALGTTGPNDEYEQKVEIARVAPDGKLVDGFGEHGVVTDHVSGQRDQPHAVAIDRDGRVLVGLETGLMPARGTAAKWGGDAPQGDGDFTVVRYNADGTEEGVSAIDLTDAYGSRVDAVAPQADGGVLVAGTVPSYEGDAGYLNRATVIRLKADGTRDLAYGDEGVATIPGATLIGAGSQPGRDDGSIVVVAGDDETGDITLRRFDASGHADPSYGGTVSLSFGRFTVARARIGQDGRVYLGDLRDGENDMRVTRFTTDGHVDQGWADHGTLLSLVGPTYPPLPGRTATADAEGRLILTGTNGDDISDNVVARYLADGSGLDPAFGQNGLYHVPVPDEENAEAAGAGAVAVDPQGRIVFAGSFGNVLGTQTSTDRRAAVAPFEIQALVSRLGGTTTTPPTTTTDPTPTDGTTTQATTPPPAATTPAKQVTAASTPPKACASRRSFKIRLRIPHGKKAKSAVVRVNGKKVKTLKGKRITAPVNLRGLPKGKVTVSISVKLDNGKTLKGTRKYKTCVPKGAAATIPVL
jgi:uncharacterized delta-60 repeat protein